MATRQIVDAIGVTKTGLVRSSIQTVMTPTDHSSCSIKLPDGALRNVNIECNAPLSSVNARVEKVSSMYGVYMGTSESGTSGRVTALAAGSNGQQPAVVFHALPRAHESAVEVRQRTIERQQEKEAKLDAFLETTRARVGKDKDSGLRSVVVKAKFAAGSDDHVVVSASIDEKTRRRLDQSLSLLLPRPSASSMSRSKRVRAWDGQVSRGEGIGAGGAEEDSLPAASDIAATLLLGDAVLCSISDGQRARESLSSHRRKHVSEDTPPSPSPSSASANAAIPPEKLDESLNNSLVRECKGGAVKEGSTASLACTLSLACTRSSTWEGSNLRHLREKENQMQIYKQVRRSLMMGERKRVRQLRSRRSEEEERERAEDAIRREGDMSRERRAAEDELLERHRQIMQQAAMAMNLEAERARQAKVAAPQQAKLEKKRYMDALRCQILEGAAGVVSVSTHNKALAPTNKNLVGPR